MAAIIIAVMLPDLTSVHVKEDFDSVMTSRRVWVSMWFKLAYQGDILKYYYFISDSNNDDNDNDNITTLFTRIFTVLTSVKCL